MRTTIIKSLLLAIAFASSGVNQARALEPAAIKDTSAKVTLKNVCLEAGETLQGQLLNVDGRPLIGKEIVVFVADKRFHGVSDRNGCFAVNGLPTGVCMIDVENATYACRLWRKETAPPKSLSTIAIVSGDTATRGQNSNQGRRLSRLTPKQRYGLAVTALVGTAGYFALSRANASE